MPWLVKHPKYIPGKHLGTFKRGGNKYYFVQWDKFTRNRYDRKNTYEHELLASECILYRVPGKRERAIQNFLRKLLK